MIKLLKMHWFIVLAFSFVVFLEPAFGSNCLEKLKLSKTPLLSEDTHLEIDRIFAVLNQTLREQINTHPTWSVQDHYGKTLTGINRQKDMLQNIESRVQDSIHKAAIRQTITDFFVQDYEYTFYEELLSHKPLWFQNRRTTDANSRELKDAFDIISTLIARGRGPLGELKAALQVESLHSTNQHVDSLLTSQEKKHLKRSLGEEKYNKSLSFELDVIYQNGDIWAEVKNRRKYSSGQVTELKIKFQYLKEVVRSLRTLGRDIHLEVIAPAKSLPHPLLDVLADLNIHVRELNWPKDIWAIEKRELKEINGKRKKDRRSVYRPKKKRKR